MSRPRRGGRGGWRSARRRARGQAGLTLAESLVALFLASVVVLALAGGMFTFLRTTRATSEAQKTQAELTRLAETVKAAPFVACTAGDPAAAYRAAAGLPASDVQVQHLSAPASTGVGSFSSTCPAPGPDRVQRVTLSYDGASAQIVKRRGVT